MGFLKKVSMIGTALLGLALLTNIAYADRYQPRKAMPKIINGEKSDEGEWPWMVGLVDGPDNYNNQFCGGALIHPKWVITAAHCVDEPPFEIVVGLTDLSDPGVRIQVVNVYVHPGYFSTTGFKTPDIALLELATETTQTPIALYDGTDTLEGITATIIGWGSTDAYGISNYPHDLMETQIPIVSQAACNAAYDGRIQDNEICAGFADAHTDSCDGDSGSPLMIYEDNTWKLAGLTSWGEGCALPGYFAVNTRISVLTEWINVTIAGAEGEIKGDYTNDGKLGLEDVIGILHELVNVQDIGN